MKSFLSCFLFSVALSLSAQNIQDLYPSKLVPLTFDKAGEQAFQAHLKRCEALWEKMKADLSQEERTLLLSCDETMAGYWSAEGGGCSWYCGGGPYEVSASSTLSSPNQDRYAASNAHDLNFKTAWVEGVSGMGIGESLIYHFMPHSPRITEIIIANGYVKSQAAWENNARVKTLKMYVYEQPYAILHLKDQRASHSFTVDPIGHPTADQLTERGSQQEWTMRFEILEVYPGTKYEDVVLSEIYFDGVDVHCFAAGTEIRMADGSQKAIEALNIGDQVISVNQPSQTEEVATILELAAPMHCQLVSLRFSDGRRLLCTADHPLVGMNSEWLSYDPSKTQQDYDINQVEQLGVGSQLMTINGTVTLTAVERIHEAQQTYTIVKLDRNQTFFANGILVGTEPLRQQQTVYFQGKDSRL